MCWLPQKGEKRPDVAVLEQLAAERHLVADAGVISASHACPFDVPGLRKVAHDRSMQTRTAAWFVRDVQL
jgi:hypothetical protein